MINLIQKGVRIGLAIAKLELQDPNKEINFNDYRFIPQLPLNVTVIYKPDSPEERNLGTF